MRTARNGFPDRFYARAEPQDVCRCCGRGRVVLIEWKRAGGGVLSANQEQRIKQLREAGVEVHVVDNLKDADAVFDGRLSGSSLPGRRT